MIGANSEAEALEKMRETKALFEKACMPLQEWTCSDHAVHKQISDDPADTRVKFLGLGWLTG